MKRLFSSRYGFCLSQVSLSPPSLILRQRQKSLLLLNQLHRTFCASAVNSSAQTDDSTPHHIYEPLEGIERLENYRPGGYHPIQIGDQFQNRYQIVHKLGHGSYSTMWLARDTQSKLYVAVKVCTADSKPREISVLSDLSISSPRCCSSRTPGKTMIPSITDQFSISGPNGTHNCYVGVLGRASLAGLKDGSWIRLFQPDVARVLAAQLVASRFHLIYHPTALCPSGSEKQARDITIAEAKLLLTDFGEAFSPSRESKYESRTPLILRPPEARFELESPLSFPSDIWTLACSVWALIAQRPLFEGFMATQDDMTCEHVDTLGILPRGWWERWDARHGRFTRDGTPINRNPYRSWDDRFEDSVQQPRREIGMVPFDEEERQAVSKMLRSMMSFRPQDRITARQVLDEEWMVRWTLPLYYDSRRKER